MYSVAAASDCHGCCRSVDVETSPSHGQFSVHREFTCYRQRMATVCVGLMNVPASETPDQFANCNSLFWKQQSGEQLSATNNINLSELEVLTTHVKNKRGKGITRGFVGD